MDAVLGRNVNIYKLPFSSPHRYHWLLFNLTFGISAEVLHQPLDHVCPCRRVTVNYQLYYLSFPCSTPESHCFSCTHPSPSSYLPCQPLCSSLIPPPLPISHVSLSVPHSSLPLFLAPMSASLFLTHPSPSSYLPCQSLRSSSLIPPPLPISHVSLSVPHSSLPLFLSPMSASLFLTHPSPSSHLPRQSHCSSLILPPLPISHVTPTVPHSSLPLFLSSI